MAAPDRATTRQSRNPTSGAPSALPVPYGYACPVSASVPARAKDLVVASVERRPSTAFTGLAFAASPPVFGASLSASTLLCWAAPRNATSSTGGSFLPHASTSASDSGVAPPRCTISRLEPKSGGENEKTLEATPSGNVPTRRPSTSTSAEAEPASAVPAGTCW